MIGSVIKLLLQLHLRRKVLVLAHGHVCANSVSSTIIMLGKCTALWGSPDQAARLTTKPDWWAGSGGIYLIDLNGTVMGLQIKVCDNF